MQVTYPMHVILRFEAERGIMRGDTKVEDLPQMWNDKMQEYLGIKPPSNKEGVLQVGNPFLLADPKF
jgi:carboxypeptidase Taq